MPVSQPHQPYRPAEPAGFVDQAGNLAAPPGAGQGLARAQTGLLVHMNEVMPMGSRVARRPWLVVDGINAPVEWGTNRVDVAPGRHLVQAGIAGSRLTEPVEVWVQPGAGAQLWFAAPGYMSWTGRLGLQPQEHPGMGLGAFLALVLGLTFGFPALLLGLVMALRLFLG